MPLVNAIPSLFEKNNFKLVDRVLDEIDYSRLSLPYMVSLLRVTSPGKEYLGNWKKSVKKASIIIENNGCNPQDHLRGLLF